MDADKGAALRAVWLKHRVYAVTFDLGPRDMLFDKNVLSE